MYLQVHAAVATHLVSYPVIHLLVPYDRATYHLRQRGANLAVFGFAPSVVSVACATGDFGA